MNGDSQDFRFGTDTRFVLDRLTRLSAQGRLETSLADSFWQSYRDAVSVTGAAPASAAAVLESLVLRAECGNIAFSTALASWQNFLRSGVTTAMSPILAPAAIGYGERPLSIVLGHESTIPLGTHAPVGLFTMRGAESNCCVDKFKYPKAVKTFLWTSPERLPNGDPSPRVQVGFAFTAEAMFSNRRSASEGHCACRCCRFRQYLDRFQFIDSSNVEKKYEKLIVKAATHDFKEDDSGKGTYGDRTKIEKQQVPDYYATDDKSKPEFITNAEMRMQEDGDAQGHSLFNNNRFVAMLSAQSDPRDRHPPFQAKKSRLEGCYYWMIDAPSVPIVPGSIAIASYSFFGQIVAIGGDCKGVVGPELSDYFHALVWVDWANRSVPPKIRYGFVFSSWVKPVRGKRRGVDDIKIVDYSDLRDEIMGSEAGKNALREISAHNRDFARHREAKEKAYESQKPR